MKGGVFKVDSNMNKEIIRNYVAKHSVLLSHIYNLFNCNRMIIKGVGNTIKGDGAFRKHCKIIIIGNNNTIVLNNMGGVFLIVVSMTVALTL